MQALDWGSILTTAGTVSGVVGLLYNWMSKKFDKIDEKFDRIDQHILEAHKRIDASIAASNARIDQMGQRIDTTQAIIMKMLEKQVK